MNILLPALFLEGSLKVYHGIINVI